MDLSVVGLDSGIIATQTSGVEWMRTLVALLLIASWLPASSHVHLQHFGLIHQIHEDHHHHEHGDGEPGHHEHGADNHAAADGECLVSSGSSALDLPWAGSAQLGFDFVPALSALGLPTEREAAGLAPPCTGPPGFSRSWQFLLRAALPVRAPSFAS